MSTGSSIPYHLRQNKAVERILFEEQLKLLEPWIEQTNNKPIKDYRYISFGGPFLEDFKSIHRNLNINDMTSIENDENTLMRQEFNKPISCIKLLDDPMDSTDFIDHDQFQKETILWLDYVNTEYVSQLNDIKNAVEKMGEFDILKVTFNANVANIRVEEGSNLQLQRYEFFQNLIPNDYLPTDLDPDDFTYKNFHKVLVKTIKNAFDSGNYNKSGMTAKILSSFLYKDGQPMLTVSCILLSHKNLLNFDQNAKLKEWEFYYNDDSSVFDISLPSLSARERIEIERLLPEGDLDAIKQHLGYRITNKKAENDLLLKNFIDYHARFPWFGKIAI
ncbi:O-methyltransferase [Vibrio sp. STUT-A11]|uniref:O-methyltransferase n=1 Tax=Vibrio sp. STUT-A11 TaxID=2976236 RepID=UPI002231DD33|nr:O-methyltransferase [Vibrio sp. STUT-A11]BDR15657.1 hypothetical protein VspSTUT11_36330 [Vibrio sp. STUT-A11]